MNARLILAAKCALADLLEQYEQGGLPYSAKLTISELFNSLAEIGVELDDYRADVDAVIEELNQ